MSGTRMAALLAASVLLLCTGACRSSPTPAPPDKPTDSVEEQLDDAESTLDGIESELNDG